MAGARDAPAQRIAISASFIGPDGDESALGLGRAIDGGTAVLDVFSVATGAFAAGSGEAQISRRQGDGTTTIEADVDLEGLAPCGTATVVLFLVGARLTSLSATVPRGQAARLTTHTGSGARAAIFGADEDEGNGANAANIGGGQSVVNVDSPTPLAGGFEQLCDACEGRWEGPDGRIDWSPVTARLTFAGNAGRWTLEARGASVSRGYTARPVFAAWAPIGEAAFAFRR